MDKEFTIGSDGKIKGIPAEYGPCYLKVSKVSGSEVPKVILRLGKREVKLPQCISKLFVLPKSEKMLASGSWYHTKSGLPI